MSFFAAGYHITTPVINDFSNSFSEVVPSEIKDDILRIEKGTSFLLNYGRNKVINDIVLQNGKTGSWIAVLGTPLINLSTEEKKAGFLERFFVDPHRTINDEVNGCFALLSYDAPSDTFLAGTDHNNTIPIFYAITPNGVLISSHELQLARLLLAEIDPLGFSMAIHVKLTWRSYTRFKNIHKLLLCQIMSFQGNGSCHSEHYWRRSDEPQWPANFDDIVSKWLSLLKETVLAYYNCSNNKTVICDFTAGEDARLVLSQCHALGIPFCAMVDGADGDIDVRVAKEAAQRTGFKLVVRQRKLITDEQLIDNAIYISLMNDAYQDYFRSCTDYATDSANAPENYRHVKYPPRF